eukprot:3315820-Amphidinium_carterae.1
MVLEIACTFVVHLLGERLLRGLQWQYGMPYALAALVCDDTSVEAAALARFERWWRVLQQLELDASSSSTCRALLSELLWPAQHWYRHILVGLQETAFKHVPSDIRGEIENWLSCFQTTVPDELVFQHLRRMETASQGHKLSRERRWMGMAASPVLSDHDRNPLGFAVGDCQGLQSGVRWPSSHFEAEAGKAESSLPEIESLTATSPTWRSPSADAFRQNHLAWLALLRAEKKGVEALNKLWLSLLATPGTVVQRQREDGSYVSGVVVWSCEWGMLLWRLDAVKGTDGKRYYMLATGIAPEPWQFQHVENERQWTSARLTPLHPADSRSVLPSSATTGAVVAFALSDRMPLLEACAKTGFRKGLKRLGWTVLQLRKLISHLKLEFDKDRPRPTRLRDMLVTLVQWVLQTTESVEMYIGARMEAPLVATVITAGNVDAVCEGLEDDDDKKDALQHVSDRERQSKLSQKRKHDQTGATSSGGKQQKTSAASAAKTGTATTGSTRKPLPKPPTPGGALTENQIKKLLPPVKGVSMSREKTWHHRWRSHYPCKTLPNSTSRTFHDPAQEWESQRHCLELLWAVHLRETETSECPWAGLLNEPAKPSAA